MSRPILIAALAASALFAASAHAQDGSASSLAAATPGLLAELHRELGPLAEAAGLSAEAMYAKLDPMILAALPEEPDTEDWSFNMKFLHRSSVSKDGEATTDRQPVFGTAAECARAFPDKGEVVSFRAIQQGGLTGYQCVLADYDGDTGRLAGRAYAQGVDRHMTATYDTSVVVTDDPAGVRAIADPVLAANVALARVLADLAVEGCIRDVYHPAEPAA